VVLAAGGSAVLGPEVAAEWIVAVDVRDTAGRAGAVRVRVAAQIDPEGLLEICADRVEETDRLVWNAETERVDRVSGLGYGALALDESVVPAPPGEEATRILAEAALARGLDRLPGGDGLGALLARVDFVRAAVGAERAAALPAVDADDVAALLRLLCAGRTSMAELASSDLPSALLGSLPIEAQRLVETMAPERVALPSGRKVAVHYRQGQPPWIESRLQDFFGMRAGPAVAGGRVPLTLHLLAPNGRAVQVTSDLGRFWTEHYPALRRALSRRYPKHAWPEDGATAAPPAPRPAR
jgi:ATP-dependent helicase HrpB